MGVATPEACGMLGRGAESALIARFLWACCKLGLDIRLPACLFMGKAQSDKSWHALRSHLGHCNDERFVLNMERVASSWGAIERRLARCRIRQPHQLVLDPHAIPPVWLVSAPGLRRSPDSHTTLAGNA